MTPSLSEPFGGGGWPDRKAREGNKGTEALTTVLPCGFGPYELIEELGRGGVGMVFRARDRRSNRYVALKLLQAGELASWTERQRFQNEAEAVKQLAHPHIVPLHESGNLGPHRYLSMRLIEGATLAVLSRNCIERNTAWLRQSVVWVIAVAHAVHYAHERGILHRDIKPGNILVDHQGWPFLTDFGLAKWAEHLSSLTGSRCAMGTPQYAPPEQLDGNSHRVTTASDVYSLGAVLYELLTGRPPFAGPSAVSTARQVLDAEPRPPGLLNPNIDCDLSTICLACLQKDPARRYRSAEAMAGDLECWLNDQPITARPMTSWERVIRFVRRKPLTSVLVALLALELAVGAGLLVRSNRNLHRALQTADKAARNEQAARRTERLTLQSGLIDQASALRRSHAVGRRFEAIQLLQKAGELMASDRLATEVVAALANSDLRELWRHPLPPTVHSDSLRRGFLTLDAQLQSLVVDHPDDGLIIESLGKPGGTNRFEENADRAASGAVLSPDGVWFICSRHASLELWASTGTNPLEHWPSRSQFAERTDGRMDPVAFAADSGRLAVPAVNGGIRVVRLRPSRRETVIAPHLNPSLMAFDPSNRWLAVSQGREMNILDPDTGESVSRFVTSGGIRWFEWAPGGEELAVAPCNCTRVELRDPTSGQLIASIGLAAPANRMAFHPGGRMLAVATDDKRISLWELPNACRLLDLEGRSRVLQFSSDGTRFAVAGTLDEIICYEVVPPGGYRELLPQRGVHSESGYTLDVSANGRWVVTADPAALRFWDVARGVESVRLDQPSPVWTRVRFAPDDAALWIHARPGGVCRCALGGMDGSIQLGNCQPLFGGDDYAYWDLHPPHALGVVADPQAVHFWTNAAPGQRRCIARWENEVPTNPSLSPNGCLLALIQSLSGQVEVWSVDQARRLHTLPDTCYTAVAFTPDNLHLVAAGRTTLELWDVRAWTKVRTIDAQLDRRDFECMRFSPDGRILLVQNSANSHRLYSYPDWSKLLELTSPEILSHHECEWSDDGERLYTLGRGNRLYEWNLPVLADELARLGFGAPAFARGFGQAQSAALPEDTRAVSTPP
jgi:serine/threonine protein kinase/WD40 repeat protein